MIISEKRIKIKDLIKGYKDSGESGVVAYDGKLNVRPAYQREFIYKEKQRDAVIDTVLKNFPLNVMYWASIDDNHWEIMDGQQRTISICQYCASDFSVNYKYIHNLKENQPDIYGKIMNYDLFIYECKGTRSEILEWFRVINIAGEKLTEQELRNISYTGSWLSDAKKYFSKQNCVAQQIASKYINGSAIRQEYLETSIKWIAKYLDEDAIEDYMANHMNDKNAQQLWEHFKNVIDWVKQTFPKYRKEMKGVDWNTLYIANADKKMNIDKLEKEVNNLMSDDEIENKSGIYIYVLSDKNKIDEKVLNLRRFTDSIKRSIYEKQKGICPICKKHFEINEMDGDHIKAWSKGGKTDPTNCQMLCKKCNHEKNNRY